MSKDQTRGEPKVDPKIKVRNDRYVPQGKRIALSVEMNWTAKVLLIHAVVCGPFRHKVNCAWGTRTAADFPAERQRCGHSQFIGHLETKAPVPCLNDFHENGRSRPFDAEIGNRGHDLSEPFDPGKRAEKIRGRFEREPKSAVVIATHGRTHVDGNRPAVVTTFGDVL